MSGRLLDLALLAAVMRRAAVAFITLIALWIACALTALVGREPLLAQPSLVRLVAPLVGKAFVPSLLSALALAVAGTFAERARDGELLGGCAVGRPVWRWVVPVAILGLSCAPFLSWAQSEIVPRARSALRDRTQALRAAALQSPRAVLERLGLGAMPSGADGSAGADAIWFASVDAGGAPRLVVRAEQARWQSPGLQLAGLTVWDLGASAHAPQVLHAAEGTIPRVAAVASDRLAGPRRAPRPRELDGDALSMHLRDVAGGATAHAAELASRRILSFAPVALVIAAAVAGLTGARQGRWSGYVRGLLLASLLLLVHEASLDRAEARPWLLPLMLLAWLVPALVAVRRLLRYPWP